MLIAVLVLLVLLSRYVKSFSNGVLTERVWQIKTKLFPSQEYREFQETRDELMRLRKERANTSSQDNFAKWARLDREYQRVKKIYDAKNNEVGSSRQKLSTIVRVVKWLLSTGLRTGTMIYFRKEPVVWLPHGMLPSIGERIVAMPSRTRGSVSASFWVFAVDSTFSTCYGIVKFLKTKNDKK